MTSTIINNFPFVVSEERRRKEKPGMNRFIERIHSCAQQPCKCIGTKESVYISKELKSHRIGLVLQHGRRLLFYKTNMAATCRHVHTLHTLLWRFVCFLIVKTSNKRNENY